MTITSGHSSLAPCVVRLALAPASYHYQRLSAWAPSPVSPHCSYCTRYFKAKYPPAKVCVYIYGKHSIQSRRIHGALVMTPWWLCRLSGPSMTWVNVGPSSQPPRAGDTRCLCLLCPDLNLRTFWWTGSAALGVERPHTNMGGHRIIMIAGKKVSLLEVSVTQGPRLSITLICPRGKEKQTELNV